MKHDHTSSPAASARSDAAPSNARAGRHDGWSDIKLTRFLEALAGTGSVTTAAKAVGMSRQSAYRIRARLIGQPFDLAWETALEFGIQQIAHEAVDRALNGARVPVYYRGEKVGERRVFNERAVLNILTNPHRIGRSHLQRDWMSRDWHGLMARIAEGGVMWTEEEEEAYRSSVNPEGHEPGDQSETEMHESPEDGLEAARRQQRHFAQHESLYSAAAISWREGGRKTMR